MDELLQVDPSVFNFHENLAISQGRNRDSLKLDLFGTTLLVDLRTNEPKHNGEEREISDGKEGKKDGEMGRGSDGGTNE